MYQFGLRMHDWALQKGFIPRVSDNEENEDVFENIHEHYNDKNSHNNHPEPITELLGKAFDNYYDDVDTTAVTSCADHNKTWLLSGQKGTKNPSTIYIYISFMDMIRSN